MRLHIARSLRRFLFFFFWITCHRTLEKWLNTKLISSFFFQTNLLVKQNKFPQDPLLLWKFHWVSLFNIQLKLMLTQATPLTKPAWAFILPIMSWKNWILIYLMMKKLNLNLRICSKPGNLSAFQMMTVLSTLHVAKYWSFEDHAKSITSKNLMPIYPDFGLILKKYLKVQFFNCFNIFED